MLKILQGEVEKRNGIYYEYDPNSTPLGEGGMGIVYKGFRVNTISGVRQVVAIKAMRDGLPEEVYRRAHREASIQLKNDNLIEMMAFISTEEQEFGGGMIQRFYVVSEFLKGIMLTDLLKGNFKDTDGIDIAYAKQLYSNYISDRETTAIQIIRRVLAGIMALHDKGYIHRDIDPSNIMVTKEGNLKMIDFGIAKDVSNLNTNDGLRTSSGQFIGKAEYASPELVLGDVHHQNFSTDIYAIGILFYQLLVGKLPFEGNQYDVLQAQLKKNVPVGNVPFNKYRSIIKKATAKEQSSRYQSCYEMRLAIDNPPVPINWNAFITSIVLIVSVTCGIIYYFHNKQQDVDDHHSGGEKVAIAKIIDNNQKINTSEQKQIDQHFEEALSELNSMMPDQVKSGWNRMMDLAQNKDYPAAKREIGLTLFADHKVHLSSAIENRRKYLDLPSDEKVCREEAFSYLNDIQSGSTMTGEALVALGIIHYRNSNWTLAKSALKDAIGKLKKSDPLYSIASDYIKDLK